MTSRKGLIQRETKETQVRVELELEGRGEEEITTGLRLFDHFLSQLARHGLFDLNISATGADPHHVVEDVAICLGRALGQALGERRGIARLGHALVPMDEVLVLVAVDLGGRGYAQIEASLGQMGELPPDLIPHFLRSLATEARMNLHAQVLRGDNDHHKAEALFKALARALDMATRIDPRLGDKPPSTKEIID